MTDITWIYISAVAILVLMAAFFSAAETAITTTSKGKIHHLSLKGVKSAQRVEKLLDNKEKLIGAILVGSNVVNVLSSAIATGILISFFGETGVFYATGIMTVLLLVFGEIVPKTYALKNAEKLALISSPILVFITKTLSPIITLIQKVTNSIVNSGSKNKDDISDLDEIRGTIELKHKEGSIVGYDKNMISSILDLGEVTINEVMIHRKNVKSINIDQDMKNIIKQAFDMNHTRVPLWRKNEDNIVAILNVKKLIKALHKNYNDIDKVKPADFISKPWFIPSRNNLRNQLLEFRKKRKRFALVVDEYGDFMGIATLEDILEEIVGNINDRGKTIENSIIKIKNGGYRIFGELPIRDINRQLNWSLPDDDEDASTLAGLIISKTERIPEEKETFDFDGYKFKILKKEQNKIILLQVAESSLGSNHV